MSGRLKSIVEHRIGELGKRVSCAEKNGCTDLNAHMTCFYASSCLLGVAVIAYALKF